MKTVFSMTHKVLLVPIAMGSHLFPFRTEPLSPSAPMVLELMLRESRSVPTQINRLALYPVRMQGFFVLATKWPQNVSLLLRFWPQITRIYTDSLRGSLASRGGFCHRLHEFTQSFFEGLASLGVVATDYANLHR